MDLPAASVPLGLRKDRYGDATGRKHVRLRYEKVCSAFDVPEGRPCRRARGGADWKAVQSPALENEVSYLSVLGPSGQGRVGDWSRRRQAHRASRRVDPTAGERRQARGAPGDGWAARRDPKGNTSVFYDAGLCTRNRNPGARATRNRNPGA